MARFAAIDVGSNAMRLRVIEAERPSRNTSQLDLALGAPSTWKEIASTRAPVRLGSEVFQTGRLTHSSIGAACQALKDFRGILDDARVDAYRAIATSAVREASNATTLVERARREAGVDLEIIEGVEEARLIELAVVRKLELRFQSALLVDVGGGSTEITLLEGGEHAFSMSLPIGTVRLLEAFAGETSERTRARLIGETVDRVLGEALPHLEKMRFEILVGTGGNIETLADLCPTRWGGQRAADVAQMRVFYNKWMRTSAAERARTWGLRPDRADTILPATAIFLRIAEAMNKTAVVTPGVGLKEGVLHELVLKHFELWDTDGEATSVLGACMRLGRRYQFDEQHGRTVAEIAAALFDDMQQVHLLGPRDRLLLRAAAVLHDIGDFVRYDGHHKHSYYLISNSDIIGLTPEERAIVANIARYHRKSLPDPSHPNFRELDRDARGKVRALAAILRIADALDREHLGKVRLVRAAIDKDHGKLRLALSGNEERALEEWTVRAKADLMRDVFDLDVVFGGD